jgi:CelD/BcsL family acetyltransferase involved in cellulose biosynthesis
MIVTQVAEPLKLVSIDTNSARPSYSASLENWRDTNIRAEWQRLVDKSDNSGAFFQSPQWFEHLHAIHPTRRFDVLALRNRQHNLEGVIAINQETDTLHYYIGKRTLWRAKLDILTFAGGTLVLPPNASAYDHAFTALCSQRRDFDCINFNAVRTDDFLWCYIHQSPLVRRQFIRYVPEGVKLLHWIRLPDRFHEYLSTLPPKDRRELERKMRRLREHGQGKLSLKCYRSSEDCDEFVAAAARVASAAWQNDFGADILRDNQHWQAKVRSLAELGVLRSYILRCGDTPCSAEFGCCFNGVFHGILTYYDPSFAKFSPGAVLHYLYLQDLVEQAGVRLVCLGSGDFSYKRWFGNVINEEGSIFLFRRNILNHARYAAHVGLRSIVKYTKRGLSRFNSAPVPSH